MVICKLNHIFFLQSLALEKISGYKPADLKECVLIIHDLQLSTRGGSLVAVREKYNQRKVTILLGLLIALLRIILFEYGYISDSKLNEQFKCVSRLSSPEEIPISFFEDVEDS